METLKNWLGVELDEVSCAEKLVSGAGGLFALVFLYAACVLVLPLQQPPGLGLLVPVGASAVLVFAMPHGPLSQPWPVVAGHLLSAAIGVACARWIPSVPLAAGLAVGLSIWAMHEFKCIHPPGGATALGAVVGGPELRALGFQYLVSPVLVNVLLLVLLAVAFNGLFRWRRYPSYLNHRDSAPAPDPDGGGEGPSHEEIMRALRELDSFVDISEDDLIRLVRILRRPRSKEGHHHDAGTEG